MTHHVKYRPLLLRGESFKIGTNSVQWILINIYSKWTGLPQSILPYIPWWVNGDLLHTEYHFWPILPCHQATTKFTHYMKVGTKKPEIGPKCQKIGTKGPKFDPKAQNGPKMPENGLKRAKVGPWKPENGPKMPENRAKRAKIGPQKPEICRKCQKISRNRPKLDPKCQNWTPKAKKMSP